jgi:hypothetical protein
VWFVEVSMIGVPHALRSVAGNPRQVPPGPAQSFQHSPEQDDWQQIPPMQLLVAQLGPELHEPPLGVGPQLRVLVLQVGAA